VIKEVRGECDYNEPHLIAYLVHIKNLESAFDVLELCHIPRVNNSTTDELSMSTCKRALVPDGVFERCLQQPIARPAVPYDGGPISTSMPVVPANPILESPPIAVLTMDDFVPQSAQG
jgi:hypothetical protein